MGTDEASTVTCQVCGSEWTPHSAKERGAPQVSMSRGASNAMLNLQHLSHGATGKAQAAWDSYLRLGFKTVGPTLETLAQCEETLHDGGFTDEEIAAANFDGGEPESSAERVSKRAALAVMSHHAVAAASQAQELFWCSEDPARHAALEVIRFALLAMTGSRGADLPPIDCLTELRKQVLAQSEADGGGDADRADGGGDADKRRLMAILGQVVPYIQRFGAAAAEQEAPGLVSKLGAAFGDGFAAIPQAEIKAILRRIFPVANSGSRELRPTLVLAAKAWGYVREEGNVRGRRRLLQDLNQDRP